MSKLVYNVRTRNFSIRSFSWTNNDVLDAIGSELGLGYRDTSVISELARQLNLYNVPEGKISAVAMREAFNAIQHNRDFDLKGALLFDNTFTTESLHDVMPKYKP